MKPANMNTLWGYLIVEELVRNGVTCFCLSPGARSTPLTVAVAGNKQAREMVHYDERGATFHALGYARATGQPAALICTSGTAAANFLPAVVEASMDNIPLVALTADRPPELHECGANQTIAQERLYGDFVRWRLDIPCPDEKIDPRFVLTTVDQAVYRARRNPAGPVHLNCMFREPLVPTGDGSDMSAYTESVREWSLSQVPYTSYASQGTETAEIDLKKIADVLKETEEGLLVVGRLCNHRQREAVLNLSRRLGWPTLVDITSGLRMVRENHMIHYYDLALLSEEFIKANRPATVLHLGGRFVSKRLLQFLESARPAAYILANSTPHREDPTHSVTRRVECDLDTFCRKLTLLIAERDHGDDWLNRWKHASNTVSDIVGRFCSELTVATEPSVGRLLTNHIPDNAGLFLASSMPIRGLDMFAGEGIGIIEVGANRGASGIDGTIASASGFAAGLKKAVTLLIGDLACLHDLNSLSLLNKIDLPVTVVVFNNNGGGIFELLSVAQFEDVLEPYFVTPHGLTFEHAAAMYDIPYRAVSDNAAFVTAYEDAWKSDRSSLIEVTIDRRKNRELLDRIAEEILGAPGSS